MSEKKSRLDKIKIVIGAMILYIILYLLFTMLIIIFTDPMKLFIKGLIWLIFKSPLYARLSSIILIILIIAYYHREIKGKTSIDF